MHFKPSEVASRGMMRQASVLAEAFADQGAPIVCVEDGRVIERFTSGFPVLDGVR
jgi:hypothetical protein